MKPVASLFALALALAPITAFASPEMGTDSVEVAPKAEAAPVKQHKKREHSRSMSKEHAKLQKRPSGLQNASARQPIAKPKEAKPAEKHGKKEVAKGDKKIEKKGGDSKHPSRVYADVSHPEPSLENLPPLPPPSTKIEKSEKPKVLRSVRLEQAPKEDAHKKTKPKAKVEPAKAPCVRDAIVVMRGTEEESVALTTCEGGVAPLAVEKMSVMLRPGSVAKPSEPIENLAKSHEKSSEVTRGIKKIDPRLVERLQALVDHFATAKANEKTEKRKVEIVSGYRPTSAGSFHQLARAMDFRIEGISNEQIVAFCKTLEDTGCGYYPNSSFVHIDVRDPGTGHVSWIDASGPGESPRYVSMWPPPENTDAPKKTDADVALNSDVAEPQMDDHPAHAKGEAKNNEADTVKDTN